MPVNFKGIPTRTGNPGDVWSAVDAKDDEYAWTPQTGGGGGGGTPSTTVTSETTPNQTPNAGVATTYSRGDHTHGTPPAGPAAASTVVPETAYGQASTVGSLSTYAREDHTHGTPVAPVIPAASSTVAAETTFGLASNAGTSTNFARGDHTHGSPAAPAAPPSGSLTVTSGISFGQSPQAGSATTYSKGDHSHGTPAEPLPTGGTAGQALTKIDGTNYNVQWSTVTGGTGGTPASTVQPETSYGLSSAVGISTNFAREDHTHGSTPHELPAGGASGQALTKTSATDFAVAWSTIAIPGAGSAVTSEQTYGQTSAVGSQSTFARSDHTHGSPSHELPAAGAAGQVLSKVDGTDFNVQWSTVSGGGGGGTSGGQTFYYTGAAQSFVVPAGITTITFTVKGGSGASSQQSYTNVSTGGLGATATGTLTTTPGETLQINVGGGTTTQAGGWNGGGSGTTDGLGMLGGGGGGASDIRQGGTALANRVVVAGGGGGGGNRSGGGGGAAGLTGAGGAGLNAGGGATATAGGAAGGAGTAGTLGQGGNADPTTAGGGGWRPGAGGGGLYGGGGAGTDASTGVGGGGGGSSLVPSGGTVTSGTNSGNGVITVTYGATPGFLVPVGGVTNAALLKNSATDGDFKWSPDTTTDWLSQYVLQAGRAGAQTLYLSTNTNSTLIGNGAAAGTGTVILQGDTSVSAGTAGAGGGISLRSQVRLRDIANETVTSDPAPMLRFRQTRNINFANGSFGGGLFNSNGLISNEATFVFQQTASNVGNIFISHNPVYKNAPGVAANLGQGISIVSNPTFQADGATITVPACADFNSSINFSAINGGNITGTVDWVNFEGSASVTAGATIAQFRGFVQKFPTGAGTITQMYGFAQSAGGAPAANITGFYCSALSSAGTNIGVDILAPTAGAIQLGLRNAGATAFTPGTVTISAATATIPIFATGYNLTASGMGAPVTLTSAPTIATGQNGQTITLTNTGTQPITLQDETVLAGSNMRLPSGTNFTLNQRDKLTLEYSTSLNDWVARSYSINSYRAGAQLAYTSTGTNQPATTTEAVTTLVTPAITVPANRQVRVEAYFRAANGSSGEAITGRIREGTTTAGNLIQDIVANFLPSGTQAGVTSGALFGRTYNPGAGTGKQWVVTVQVTNGVGNLLAAPGSVLWLEVRDAGPA